MKPAPSVPILPVLSSGDVLGGRKVSTPSILDVGRPMLLESGSTALLCALQRVGIGAGHAVLVPAFHCPSMVIPILQCGAEPVFYGVREDLGIGVTEVEPYLRRGVRAMIVPHLFGRLQELLVVRRLCDEHDVVLIEDCAHSFYGTVAARPVGASGHYAIASPRKFLPLAEGGVLTSTVDDLTTVCAERPSVRRSAQVAFDVIDLASAAGRLAAVRPLVRAVKAVRGLAARSAVDVNGAADDTKTAAPAVPDAVVRRASFPTRAALRHLMSEDSVRARRQNFARLRAGFRGLAGLSVVDTAREDDRHFVPYMVPVLLHDPERSFRALKDAGVPMWRWEHSVRGVCAVTDRYSRALVQVPCHQSLRAAELDRMLSEFARIVDGAGARSKRA